VIAAISLISDTKQEEDITVYYSTTQRHARTHSIASKYIAEYPLMVTIASTARIPKAVSMGVTASSSVGAVAFILLPRIVGNVRVM
jgi:hypothetical protein